MVLSADSTFNPWQVAMRVFDNAAGILQLDQGVRQRVKYFERELIVHFPVRMRDGRRQIS